MKPTNGSFNLVLTIQDPEREKNKLELQIKSVAKRTLGKDETLSENSKATAAKNENIISLI